MLRRPLAYAMIALSLCNAAYAGGHRGHPKHRPRENKIFAAKPTSIELENEVADAMGASRFLTQAEVDAAVSSGKLVPFRRVWMDRRLPYNRRYALPDTVDFIEQLSSEFNRQFNHPLTVDSAVRPATVQRSLLRWNRNAAPVNGARASTHERGTTVDLSKHLTKAEHWWLVLRLLYYKDIGRVLVIEERGCFHIFIRSDE